MVSYRGTGFKWISAAAGDASGRKNRSREEYGRHNKSSNLREHDGRGEPKMAPSATAARASHWVMLNKRATKCPFETSVREQVNAWRGGKARGRGNTHT
ncbi:hypothetical protein BDV12DRAFT_170309 [Aspergillus spectabilis]